MRIPVRVLSIQESDIQTELIVTALRNAGFVPASRHITSLSQLRKAITSESWDIILCSYHTVGCDGLQVLAERAAAKSGIPIIMIDRAATPEEIAGAMRLGAADFITPGNWRALKESITREMQKQLRTATGQGGEPGDARGVPLTDLDRERREIELRRLNQALRDEMAIRRQIEVSLRESEKRFRTLADGTPIIIWTTDASGKNQFVNKAWCDFFGFSEAEAQSVDWKELLHPEDFDGYTEPINEAIQAHRGFVAQARVRRSDGSWRWIESHGEPRLSDSGEFLGLAGSTFDITEHKEAEEALRESEERFRTMADGTPILIWITDASGRIQFVNRAYCDFFDVTEEQVRSDGWHMLMHPDDEAYAFEVFGKAIESHIPLHSLSRVRRHDGEWRWIESHGEPRFSASGEFLGLAGSSLDVSERKQTAEALRQARQQLETITSSMEAGVTRCSRDLRYLWVSPAYARWVGLPPEDIIDRHIIEILGEDGVASIMPYVRKVLTGEPVEYEAQVPFSSLGTRWIHAAYTPTYDASGEVDGWVAVVTDTTDRKRTEEALRLSESKYHSFFEYMREAVTIFEAVRNEDGQIADFVYRDVNPMTLQITGLNTNDLVGKRTSELAPPGRFAELLPLYARVLETGESASFESAFNGRDLHLTVFRLTSNDLASVALDITEAKNSERALRESEERFRVMADSAPVLIWVNSLTGADFVNRAYREFLGVTKDIDVAGYDWAQYVHSDDREAYLRGYWACLNRQVPFEAVFRFRRHDGEYRWMKSIGQPRFSQSGEFLGYVGCTVDITDVRRLETMAQTSRPITQQ